jgi:hypothetical protein
MSWARADVCGVLDNMLLIKMWWPANHEHVHTPCVLRRHVIALIRRKYARSVFVGGGATLQQAIDSILG